MTGVKVEPALLRWASERSGYDESALTRWFPEFPDWARGEKRPTFKQLEDFAKRTRTPFGYFFLSEPPVEELPIADFRTVKPPAPRPSPELLDTVYAMQQRQDFLRDQRIEDGVEPLAFVGSARLSDDPEAVGQAMRRALGLENGWTTKARTWQDAVSELRRCIEESGVMAVINSVVGNNTHRKLDVEEFRGFALVDPYAPLIFVNGADAKSAQMFTLAHELAHIWLGAEGEGLSGFHGIFPVNQQVEKFCDQAAAAFLIPSNEFKRQWPQIENVDNPFERAASHFKVSPIVAGRRALDLCLVDRETFFTFYQTYTAQERRRERKGDKTSGGDFYKTQNARVGKRFATVVINAALEGKITFREAYDLTGLRGGAFQEYARRIGAWLP